MFPKGPLLVAYSHAILTGKLLQNGALCHEVANLPWVHRTRDPLKPLILLHEPRKKKYVSSGYITALGPNLSVCRDSAVRGFCTVSVPCANLRSDHCLSLHDLITYVTSDLVSTLRYRMYLIAFPVSYLDIFDARLASAVKRLSHMAKSTITNMLIDQGLQNIYLLQGSTRTQFLLGALEAPDIHCKLTSRILHARAIEVVSSKGFKGTSPFSSNGLQIATSTRQARKIDRLLPPIFRGVRQNLIKTKSCIQTTFNHVVNANSRNIDETLKPLALNALINNAGLPFKGCTHKRLIVLSESLEKCLFVSLDEISPLFHINYAGNEAWMAMKGLKYLDPKQMCEVSGLKALYRLPYLIDSTKNYQKHLDQSSIILLGVLVAHFAFSLLKPHQRDSEAPLETSSNWGVFKKGSVAATSIFVDGSCSDKNIFPVKAGFALCVPYCFNLKQNAPPNLIIKSRIPGSQTSERAEAFAILAALMLTSDLSPLKIYTGCLSLVTSINRFSQTPPQPHEKAKMLDRSLLLRILSRLNMRTNKVKVLYLSNHKPDPRNKLTTYSVMADREAKLSLNSQIVSVPDEKTHLDDTVL
jgi:ribonuclease HI